MKRIATILNHKNQVIGLVHGPDAIRQTIKVKGKTWRFDFDNYFGPLWLKKDFYTPLQKGPPKAVWKAFDRWLKRYKKKRAEHEKNRKVILY